MSDVRPRPLVFGAELSPYSVKVRSYLRYKAIDHDWTERNPSNMALFQQHAKLPLQLQMTTPRHAQAPEEPPPRHAPAARQSPAVAQRPPCGQAGLPNGRAALRAAPPAHLP